VNPVRGKLTIVGCGPGGREYLTRQAEQAAAEADLICGPPFLLDLFPDAPAERVAAGAHAGQVADLVGPMLEERKVVLLVTGDPGMRSLAGPVARILGRDRVQVISGISSLQLAFARLCLPWEQVRVFSLHGVPDERAAGILEQALTVPVAAVLCSPAWEPRRVLGHMAPLAGYRTAHVFSDLGRPAEYRLSGRVGDLAREVQGSGRSIVVLTED